MILLEKIDISGWETAIRGMRNPMNSWENSDSEYGCDDRGGTFCTFECGPECTAWRYKLGNNDLSLMKKLVSAGSDHGKFLRIQYNRKIKELEEQLDNAHRDIRYFRSHYEFAERETQELKDWIERLLEYTELSKDDIKAACEKDKRAAEALSWLSQFSSISKFIS